MSATLLMRAEKYTDRMLAREMQCPGDKDNALDRIAEKYGIAPNTFEHIRKRKAKDIKGTIFDRIRNAYLDMCERQVGLLKEEIRIEQAISGDDTLQDLMAEADRLACLIEAKKEQRA